MRAFLAPIIAAGLLLAACGSSGGEAASSSPAADANRVVVLVSGVDSVTPFTTPDAACTSGLSAGTTWAFMRDYLTQQGFKVYTAPVMDTESDPVPPTLDDTVRGPFGGCPEQLGTDVTIRSIHTPIEGGQHLAAFINLLREQYGVTSIDVVAHSLGGIFARNGLHELKMGGSPVTVRSFTTLSSPWEPVMLAVPPYDPPKACDGFELCMGIVEGLETIPAVREIVDSFQPDVFIPWTEQQVGVLDNVPVTLVAGTMFTKPGGNPDKWPNDGFVQYSASTARTVPDNVLPIRACYAFPFAHSPFTARLVGAPDDQSVTWNAAVGSVVATAIRRAGTPEQAPNRMGCPNL